MTSKQLVKSVCPEARCQKLYPSGFIILGLDGTGIGKWNTMKYSASGAWNATARLIKSKLVEKLEN